MKDYIYPIRVLHGRLHEWRTNVFPLYVDRLKHPDAVYLVMTPEHGNLGDHAIAQSEIEILNDLQIPFIEITGKQLLDLETKNSLHVMNGRTILLHGGGFLGTLWPRSERLLRGVITNNPKSRIIILPNTIYYEESAKGNEELSKSIELYNNHRFLKIYAREKISFNKMKEIYKEVALAPDMVLRMNKCKSGQERTGCILCLRNDREKTRPESMDEMIHAQAHAIFGDRVIDSDMVKSYFIPVSKRDEELEKQYDAFRHSELVITDRLHGMIFCAITGTPCIVINSKSPKVRGCFEWIDNLSYIQYCDDVSKIADIYSMIPKQEWSYDNKLLLPLYQSLITDIKEAARG